jgi:putative copper export protein
MHGLLLFLHVLAATIWTGGHLVLSIVVLPRVLKERSPSELLRFESVYEKIGMPALVVQVVTGLMLARRLLPDFGLWFDFDNPIARLVALKLFLLALTLGFAIDARLRVIPRLSEETLVAMAWHIVPVTIFSVAFVFLGVSFRTGWLY